MSTRLSETSAVILDKYDGDINKLRDAAGKDLAKEKKLLKEFKVSFPTAHSLYSQCNAAAGVALKVKSCLSIRKDFKFSKGSVLEPVIQ